MVDSYKLIKVVLITSSRRLQLYQAVKEGLKNNPNFNDVKLQRIINDMDNQWFLTKEEIQNDISLHTNMDKIMEQNPLMKETIYRQLFQET